MSKGTNTRERLLQAAKTLFSVHGCRTTTIEDIITATGITKGAFYHYFKSKDQLCEMIIERIAADYEKLLDSVPPSASPLEKLRNLLETLLKLNASGQWVNCRLILRLSAELQHASPPLREKLLRFWRWYTGVYEDLIMQCRAAGQIRTDISPNLQSRFTLNLLAGTLTLEKLQPDAPQLQDMADLALQWLQHQP